MKRFSVCAVMALMAVLWGCEKKPVLVETVSLSETTLTLVEGETKVLTAEIAPADAENQSVTWSTSDKSVVTVEGGTVTAIKAGEATVTVTANDKGSVKAECKVTVTAAKVAVTGVSLDKTTLTVAAGGNAKLTATVAPTNATNKSVTWSSSDEAIATVDSEGDVRAMAVGIASITVTTADGNKTAECKVTVTEIDEIVGVWNVTSSEMRYVLVRTNGNRKRHRYIKASPLPMWLWLGNSDGARWKLKLFETRHYAENI